MTAMAADMASPRLHANRFGLADTHWGGGWRESSTGDHARGAVLEADGHADEEVDEESAVTIWIGQNVCSKLA